MFRSIIELVLGYGSAQLILIFSMPILTRFYDPSAFGFYGLLASLSTLFVPITSMRLEYAIPLTKNKKLRSLIQRLCTQLTVMFALLIFTGYLIYAAFYGFSHKLSFTYSLVLFVLIILQGLCQVLSLNFVTNGDNVELVTGKLLQNLSMVASQIALSYYYSAAGLIAGLMLGLGVNFFYFYRRNKLPLLNYIFLKKREIGYIFKKFYRFPLYSSWSAFIDNIAVVLPIFAITYYFKSYEAGIYFLVYRVFIAPVGLVSKAVSYVATKEFSSLMRDNKNAGKLFAVFTGALLLIGVAYFTVMKIAAVYAGLLFGPKWVHSKPIINLLAWVIPLMAVVSPLTCIMGIVEENKLAALWQVLYFFSTSMVLFFHVSSNFYIYIERMIFVWLLLYIIYWFFTLISVIKWNKKCAALV